jgi:hypothetical protein
MLPSGFFLDVVAQLYFTELDGFGVSVSFLCLQHLDLFLLASKSFSYYGHNF